MGTLLNAAVVLLVLGAVYSKTTTEGSQVLFRSSDIYLFAGALLAFLVLWMVRRSQQNSRKK
ncbi:MAG: hypothetical protein ACRC7I_11820 [Selenomonadaceae bacterium]